MRLLTFQVKDCFGFQDSGVPKLHDHLREAKTGHEKTVIERQIEATNQQIDRAVYQLYGLTGDEVRVVESAEGNIGNEA